MKKFYYFYGGFLIILCMAFGSCQTDELEDDYGAYRLDAVGKLFVKTLEKSPEVCEEWKNMPESRSVLPNEAALLYGGDYGLHYVLPLVQGGTIMGFVIFPIERSEGEEGLGRLTSPVIKKGEEVGEDAGFGGIMKTRAFARWQKHGLKVSKELQSIRYTWREHLAEGAMTRSSGRGFYYCLYELEFENYIDGNGNAVIVGMDYRELDNICDRIISMMPATLWDRIEYIVDQKMITFAGPKEAFEYLLQGLEDYLLSVHVRFCKIFVGGRDEYGRDYNGSSGGGGGGGGGGNSSDGKVGPQSELSKVIFSEQSRLTNEQWQRVETALERLNEDCMGGRMVTMLKDNPKIHLDIETRKNYNGSYNHSTGKLTLKFDNGSFDYTFCHELFHALQKNNPAGRLNLEIEAHLAAYKYALRNEKPVAVNTVTSVVYLINPYVGANGKIIDSQHSLHGENYNDLVSIIQTAKSSIYSTYTESVSYRNYAMFELLAVDC